MTTPCTPAPRPATRPAWLASALLTTLFALAACGGGSGGGGEAAPPPPSPPPPAPAGPTIFDPSEAPAKLSDWHLVVVDGTTLQLDAALVPYDLNTALFSDYAFKQRAIYVPKGKLVSYRTTDALDFPPGTALVKTFYFPKATDTAPDVLEVGQKAQTVQGTRIDLGAYRLVETRILVRKADGTWAGIPYVWDDDQKDATFTPQGKRIDMELVPDAGAPQKFIYAVPNTQTCEQCHAAATNGSGSSPPIGPKAANLNKDYDYGGGVVENQLAHLEGLHLLAGFTGVGDAPAIADWRDTARTLEARAKSYLDVNCAHCHNAKGYASQSGLLLTHDNVGSDAADTWGVCKLPLAYVGTGEPGYTYDIAPGSPETSILLYRMSHVGAGQTMPVVGRQTNHVEAISMVGDWIRQLPQPRCPP
jgi:uncharacterized repeat protein (TIGR03806 family)